MWYAVAIEVGDENTAFGAVVPDIPGCYSAGDSFDEVVANAREAIEGHIEILAEHGEPIPEGSSIATHLDNPEYAGWVWVAVEVDITPYLGKSHKVNVTLPDMLIKRIDSLVARQASYKSRSGFLVQAALHELSRDSGQ